MEITPETLKQAKEEIEAICQKYEILLMPVTVHKGDQTFSSIEIAPRRAFQQAQETEPVSNPEAA